MRRIALAALLCLPAAPTWAAAPSLKEMIAIHDDLDGMCRGWSGNDPHTDQACEEREKVSKLIKGMGYCYGSNWHRC